MSWLNEIANVLQNYSQENPTAAPQEVDDHFTQVAQAAPSSALADGLAAMFRSNQTPAFGQMVAQLFSNSNGSQRANLLNTLLTSPAAAGFISQLTQATGIKLPAEGADHAGSRRANLTGGGGTSRRPRRTARSFDYRSHQRNLRRASHSC